MRVLLLKSMVHVNLTALVTVRCVMYIMFYVALVKAQPILDFNDCIQLDLAKRVCALQPELMTKDTIRNTHPNCFKGLGKLGNHYHITMVDNCTHVVNLPKES